MPRHFEQFIQTQESPGLLLVHSQRPIGSVIEGLLLVWATWTEEDLRNSATSPPPNTVFHTAQKGFRPPKEAWSTALLKYLKTLVADH